MTRPAHLVIAAACGREAARADAGATPPERWRDRTPHQSDWDRVHDATANLDEDDLLDAQRVWRAAAEREARRLRACPATTIRLDRTTVEAIDRARAAWAARLDQDPPSREAWCRRRLARAAAQELAMAAAPVGR